MRKSKLILMISGIVIALLLVLIAASLWVKKEEVAELGTSFDLSTNDGKIVYTAQKGSGSMVYIMDMNSGESELVSSVEEPWELVSPLFSPGEEAVTFITIDANEKEPRSAIYEQIPGEEKQLLLERKGIITEAIYSETGDTLYYLYANTFENYSPITGARPHGFDVYQLDLVTKESSKLTNIQAYSMSNVTLSADGKQLHIIMPQSEQAKTAEEIFEEKERMYTVSLGGEGDVESSFLKEENVFDIAISPEGEQLAFTKIANFDEGGTFQYELFTMNMADGTITQRTTFERLVTHPVYSDEGKSIYFLVDKAFPSRKSDYRLYKMNTEGADAIEIKVNLPQ